MPSQIGVVTNLMFPKSPLPNAFFPLAPLTLAALFLRREGCEK
jgi:hypothetical protein